ncbi:MAG: hypothetical protein WAL27_20040 [Cellulosimicrobium cellulans]
MTQLSMGTVDRTSDTPAAVSTSEDKPRRPGHGRAAADYTYAEGEGLR